MLVVPVIPLLLAHPIPWRPLDEEIILVELFGGTRTRLVAVLEVGLIVQQSIWMTVLYTLVWSITIFTCSWYCIHSY